MLSGCVGIRMELYMKSTVPVIGGNCSGSGWTLCSVVDDLYDLTIMCAQRSCSKVVGHSCWCTWQLVDL